MNPYAAKERNESSMAKSPLAFQRKEISVWWKYALSYLLVLTIPFLVFNTYFSHYISRQTEQSMYESMQSTLSNVQLLFDQKVEQMQLIGIQLDQNRDFHSKVLENFDFAARRGIRSTLGTFVYTSMFYDNILYYNRVLPHLLFSSIGTYNTKYYRTFYDEHSGYWLTLDLLKGSQLKNGWLTAEDLGTSTLSFKEALVYCLPLSNERNGYLFFEITDASIRNLLSADSNSEIYILQDDRILYPLRSQIPENLKTDGIPALCADGRYQCALRSETTGLTYVYICESSPIGAVARTALTGFMVLTIIVSLVCMMLIVGLARQHARPIDQLVTLSAGLAPDDVHGVERIQSAMHQLWSRSQELDEMRQASMRGHALIRLVRGRYHDEREAEENLRRLDITFQQPYRVIMLMQRDGEADERDIQREVTTFLSRQHDIYGFAYAERSVFVMMVGVDSCDCQPLAGELADLTMLPEFASSHLRFSLGGIFTDFTGAQKSYMQALSSSRRNPGEPVTLFRESDENELFYPREELQALGAALANQDRNRTAFLYDVLMSLVKKNIHIYFYTVSLLSEMINLYLQALSMQATEAADVSTGYAANIQGEYINDVDDMMNTLRRLHTRALQLMTESDLNSSVTEMTGIANYISACQELDTLTVGMVAERFGINVSSLSHKFKEQMGCNISDYILTCKMNHACSMLRSTDETVADIAQRVGYSQYTSFVRTFKRLKGMTPTAYRDAWRRGEAEEE